MKFIFHVEVLNLFKLITDCAIFISTLAISYVGILPIYMDAQADSEFNLNQYFEKLFLIIITGALTLLCILYFIIIGYAQGYASTHDTMSEIFLSIVSVSFFVISFTIHTRKEPKPRDYRPSTYELFIYSIYWSREARFLISSSFFALLMIGMCVSILLQNILG